MKRDKHALIEQCFREVMIDDKLRPASISKYRSSIKRFFTVIGDKRIEELSNRDIDNFIIQMKGEIENSTIRGVINAIKWIVLRLQNKGIVFKELNLLTIKQPKIMKKEVNYLTDSEIEQFLNCIKENIEKKQTIKNIRFMAFAMLLLQTGARIGEVLSINIEDINRQNKEVPIVGKGNKPRTLFLTDETLSCIDRYLLTRHDSEKALFATQNGESAWKQTDAGRSFRKFKKLSGIKKEFTIHTLRHTFATQYLIRGAGINVVQSALGHSDPITTLKYYSGAVEKVKVKEMINDRHFDFIPRSFMTHNL